MVQSKLAAEPRWVARTSDPPAWIRHVLVVAVFGVVLLMGLAVPATRPEPAGPLSHAFLWPVGVLSLLAMLYRRPVSAVVRRLAHRSPSRRPSAEQAPRTVPG